jgi:hypothetical protein
VKIVMSLSKKERLVATSWGLSTGAIVHFATKGFEVGAFSLSYWLLWSALWLVAGFGWMYLSKKLSKMMKAK